MAVHAEEAASDRVIMTGYFYSETMGWRLLSKIGTNRSGKNYFLSGLYSFVEQWSPGNTMEPRSALYSPSFIAGDDLDWKQVKKAQYDYGNSENHEHVNGWYNAADNDVGIATGGEVVPVATQYEVFSYEAKDSLPFLLLDLSNRIACLNTATTPISIDKCLEEEEIKEEVEDLNEGDSGSASASVGAGKQSLFASLLVLFGLN